MKVGVVFPQTEIGTDPGVVRDYIQTVEDLGYSHLIAYDHVLGAHTQFHQNWTGGYTSEHQFHEPFVTFGYIAAITKTLELVTAILILGQRQTALVAKQAAAVDVLSGGRLRLGVGIGWNHVEYEALGANFRNRGRRSEEQIELLRALWTQEVVNYEGQYHKITHAGINPLPVQQPIPIWMGVGARANPVPQERVLRRVARLADGWFPQFSLDGAGKEAIAKVREYATEAGRDPNALGMEARINFDSNNVESMADQARGWEELGATHVSVNTMRAGLSGPDQHIDAIRQFSDVVQGYF